MGTIVASGIGKYYKRYRNRWWRLAEWLERGHVEHHEKHWVLRDIDFAVQAGESVGIIGHNGAGKSTLLKIITGTTQPSAGSVQISGRVAALLELGMGFHPEFTGRQNAFMSGQLLGFSNEEIAARMDEIEAFAEIGDYIDQPVRTYSSGMQVRLAFSVATAIRPDILIVDEALAVGDVFFQQKCFNRIRSFREAGTTLLFVSHAPGTIYSLCDRAILLDHGRLVCDADPKTVIDLYQRRELEQMNAHATTVATSADPPIDAAAEVPGPISIDTASPPSLNQDFETGRAEIDSVTLLCDGVPSAAVISDREVTVQIAVSAKTDVEDPHVGFQIRDARGEPIFMTTTYGMGQAIGPLRNGESVIVSYTMKLGIAAGEYTITSGVANGGYGDSSFREQLVRRQAAARFTVAADRLGIRWGGICNLQPALRISREHTAQLAASSV